MNELTFTKTEKDHLEWLLLQHRTWVLEQFNTTEDEKERETLMISLKVDNDITEKLWQDKEYRNKLAEAKFRLERAKK